MVLDVQDVRALGQLYAKEVLELFVVLHMCKSINIVVSSTLENKNQLHYSFLIKALSIHNYHASFIKNL